MVVRTGAHRGVTGIAAAMVAAVVGVVLGGCAAPSGEGALAEIRSERDAVASTAHAAATERSAVFLRDRWGPVALPDTPIDRWIAAHEWAPTVARCLDGAGFPGVLPADDGERLDFSALRLSTQREFFEIEVEIWVCQARYPVLSWFADDVRAIEAPWAFDYLTTTLVPCLLAHGYEVPTAPAAADFAARWRTETAFDPYALVRDTTGDRTRAAARCPAPETVLDGAS